MYDLASHLADAFDEILHCNLIRPPSWSSALGDIDTIGIQLDADEEKSANRSRSGRERGSSSRPLKKDNRVDKQLQNEEKDKLKDPKFQKMLASRQSLPAFEFKDHILSTVASSPVVVISGETGCGKSTQVPQFILDWCIENGNGSACNVVCTQVRISLFSLPIYLCGSLPLSSVSLSHQCLAALLSIPSSSPVHLHDPNLNFLSPTVLLCVVI